MVYFLVYCAYYNVVMMNTINMFYINLSSNIINGIAEFLWKRRWKKYHPIYILMFPFTVIYYAVHKLKFRIQQPIHIQNAVVICVGNAIVGGGGKTPTAISLAQHIIERHGNIRVAFISTGYGGSMVPKNTAYQVTPQHTAIQVGDEPLLLAQVAPTYISRNRVVAAMEAVKNGARFIIMDDGLQDNSIYKDFVINVINIDVGLQNGFLLPLGPLRTTLREALAHTNLLLLLYNAESMDVYTHGRRNDSATHLYDTTAFYNTHLKQHVTHSNMQLLTGSICVMNSSVLQNAVKSYSTVIALAGIASPRKFEHSLNLVNISVNYTLFFRDHYQYTDSEMDKIIAFSKRNHSLIITTAKDMVRINTKYHQYLLCAKIQAVIQWKSVLQFDKILHLS